MALKTMIHACGPAAVLLCAWMLGLERLVWQIQLEIPGEAEHGLKGPLTEVRSLLPGLREPREVRGQWPGVRGLQNAV